MSKAFEKLIRAACEAEAQFQALASNTKLTCEAIVAGCLERAGSTPEKLAQLKASIEARRRFLPNTVCFMTHLAKMFEAGSVTGGVPNSAARMSLPGRGGAIAELGAMGGSLFELWALVALRVQEKHPEVFGQITDLAAHKEELEALNLKRHELFQRIAKEYAADDLHIGSLQRNGAATISYKVGQVPLAPVEDAGARLVAHLLATDPQTWGVNSQCRPSGC
jgi:hypothetical protein